MFVAYSFNVTHINGDYFLFNKPLYFRKSSIKPSKACSMDWIVITMHQYVSHIVQKFKYVQFIF